MSEDFGKGRWPADKIALVGLLIVSLLAAWAVIGLRTGVRLSAPMELKYSGLSIAMPLGNGWQCEKGWAYRDSTFMLNSVFAGADGVVKSYAHCHYTLTAGDDSLSQRFSREAASVEGEVVETGQTNLSEAGPVGAGALVVDWALIRTGGSDPGGVEVFFGVCRLPAGRLLDVEVVNERDEKRLGERVFGLILKSIRFSDNGLLQAGAELVAQVRAVGLAGLIRAALAGEPAASAYFLLSDARGRRVGFTIDTLSADASGGAPQIKAATYYYVRGRIPDEEVGLLESDNAFEQFTWRVESSSLAGSSGLEMTAKDDVLTVREFRGPTRESEVGLGAAAVPDAVVELVLGKMLDMDRQAAVIDLVRPDGAVAPLYVQKIQADKLAAAAQQCSYALKVELLDGRRYVREICFGANRQQTGARIRQDRAFTSERSSAEDVAKIFPERASLILHQNEFPGEGSI